MSKANMKFGIHTFHLENLQETGLNLQEAEQALNPARHIEHCADLGIRNFEITYDINLLMMGDNPGKIADELLEIKEKRGLTYSVHLPFRGVDLCYPDKEIGKAYAGLMSKAIALMAPLKPEAYVIHPTGGLGEKLCRKLPENTFTIGTLVEQCRFVMKSIIEKSGIDSRMLAVENLKFPFTALHGMIEDLDLSVCLDAGHLAAGYSGTLTQKEFIDRFMDRIIEIHLHDACRRQIKNGMEIHDHMQLGKGDLDWKQLIGYLSDKGYDKRIILEMKFDDALLSLEKIKSEFCI